MKNLSLIFILLINLTFACGTTDNKEQDESNQYLFQSDENPQSCTMTIVFDNYTTNDTYQTAWGFACYIQYGSTNILFDTGCDGEILLSNMETLGIQPSDIDYIVISHEHSDHINGLPALLQREVSVPVYVLASFSDEFKNNLSLTCEVIEVTNAREIIPGVYSAGDMGESIHEQSLVIESNEGLIVLTGCAHPGISNIVDKACEMLQGNIHVVMGGFHLLEKSEAQVQEIIDHFNEMNVEKVGATHCTGDNAILIFKNAYGDNYMDGGVGRVINIP